MSLPSPSPTGTFRPLMPSRKGEAYAWGLTAVMAIAAMLTAWRTGRVPWFVWLLLGFFLGSGLLTSFGHWVDKHTVLTLNAEGVAFRNGLRRVTLAWAQVTSVRIHNDRWGKRVQVQGKDGLHFAFRTLAQAEVHPGKPQNLFGFQEGEAIAAAIIQAANLTQESQSDSGTYYTRA